MKLVSEPIVKGTEVALEAALTEPSMKHFLHTREVIYPPLLLLAYDLFGHSSSRACGDPPHRPTVETD